MVGGAKTSLFGGGIDSDNDTLTIRNSAITDNSIEGKSLTSAAAGGGISIYKDTMTIDNSQISGNTVASKESATGGALFSDRSSVTITHSSVSQNSVVGDAFAGGGAIANSGGPLTLNSTTITHNTVTSSQQIARGGGIFSVAALIIDESTIADNSATAPAAQYGAFGGGIDSQGTLILTRTTISANSASSQAGVGAGGGIFVKRTSSATDHFSLTNCTIADNQALGSSGVGGGFSTDISPKGGGSIDFCTIAGNRASTRGGGIDGDAAGTPVALTLVLKNSLVAGNLAGTGPDLDATLVTGGYNLVGSFTGATIDDPQHLHTTDISGNSIGLDTQLRANGGPTLTLALQAGSPAMNAVPVTNCDVTTDQRGVKRPQHNACDIGSYEYI